MPGKLKVKIIAGRNLPVMDRSSDTTDAFVEIKLGTVTYKTDVCRKTLNPQWNSEWYKFEMEDAELQDEPLQIRLMDYDTYSANDAIGKVYLNLNPLLLPSSLVVSQDYSNLSNNQVKGLTISGWLPVYDTMHGIRGEVNIVVKLDLFEDFNRFRQSSCGIQFFSSSMIPEGYELKAIHGFVEELVFADDPEYQWIDKIRTPRSTNEARQTLFFKLNGQVKRKIGLKVLDIGANSVVGYKQCFDLEGECGVVVRGLGTAVTLDPITPLEFQDAKREPSPLCRRSSDSDISVVPRGNSLVITDKPSKPTPAVRPTEPLDMGEYPFLTLTKYPAGFIQHIGGVVSARAVKLLGVDEAETRDSWWTELRLEVRSHARALACNAVIAYSEHTTVWDDVCILSASGTAAVISQNPNIKLVDEDETGCSVYHIPYNEASHPFRMKLSKCLQCKNGKVGEILLSTADLMDGSNVDGKGSLIQASVTRVKRECKGEMNAKEVSDALPFIEYELHTQLMHRISSSGCNGIIGLKVEICLGERILVGYATGTGIRLSALPPPLSPNENNDLVGSDEDDIEEELRELDLNSGNKETNIVEVGNDCGGGNVGVPPDGFLISTTQGIPGASAVGLLAVRNLQMFTQIWKAKMCPLPSSASISAQFHRLLQGVYFKLRGMTPCALANLRIKVDLPQPDDLQISVVGMAVGLAEVEKHLNNCNSNYDGIELKMSRVDEESARNTPTNRPSRKSIHTPPREQRYGVDVSPLCYVPGARISNYLGNLNFFFIRESSCIRESGGLSSFVHGFVAEVLAIVRAHVTAIGGNALISYTMSECYLMNNTHKNQAQCLINVGGDAVFVKYTECNV
ncbi:C2 domain-containing protein 5 isoform X3 [Halyomorpha halys]|uniref:C2 domain-containing protein 5 isoform X3 n=1 Tax=Halyomorpha halys TaxID=286706 RepID=UPI0006D4E872|nr:C2 domain-containing protein 5 isoform X3 [Halyomorpha halys]